LQTAADRGCTKKDCANRGKGLEDHPDLYGKGGTCPDTGRPRRLCRACGRRFVVGPEPPRIHPQNRHLASEVFSRVVNKSPVRRTMRGAALGDKPQIYYDLIKFARRRCNDLSGGMDRALLRGRLRLPDRPLRLATDIQEYALNWTNRLDKRNPVFSAICTVDCDSRFVFGLHANYDPDMDAFAVNRESARNGDMERPEAFRRHARLWLVGDEFEGGRAAGERAGIERVRALRRQIASLYASAERREDVEDGELQEMHPGLYDPQAGSGMQVHVPYTAYAHFFLVRQILAGAGVRETRHAMDCESLLRAGFLCAFREEVRAGRAHGFYVRNVKYLTVPEREAAKKAARRRLAAFAQALPLAQRRRAALLLMEANLKRASAFGKWSDRWTAHPLPTMNEPEKAVCWLTPNSALPSRAVARMALEAGLGAVDNVFQLTRRLINALERPIGTSSGYNTVWHGYAPYNPAMLQRYLDLFRCVHNFCNPGQDGATPAMRLGWADRPLDYDDVLWPGEEPPRPPVEAKTVREDALARWLGDAEAARPEKAPSVGGPGF